MPWKSSTRPVGKRNWRPNAERNQSHCGSWYLKRMRRSPAPKASPLDAPRDRRPGVGSEHPVGTGGLDLLPRHADVERGGDQRQEQVHVEVVEDAVGEAEGDDVVVQPETVLEAIGGEADQVAARVRPSAARSGPAPAGCCMLWPSNSLNSTYWQLTLTLNFPWPSVSGRSRKIGPSVSRAALEHLEGRIVPVGEAGRGGDDRDVVGHRLAIESASALKAEPRLIPTDWDACARSSRRSALPLPARWRERERW